MAKGRLFITSEHWSLVLPHGERERERRTLRERKVQLTLIQWFNEQEKDTEKQSEAFCNQACNQEGPKKEPVQVSKCPNSLFKFYPSSKVEEGRKNRKRKE